MTDFFARLAARNRGDARELKTRHKGVFEPVGQTADGFSEAEEERVATTAPRTAPDQETPTPQVPETAIAAVSVPPPETQANAAEPVSSTPEKPLEAASPETQVQHTDTTRVETHVEREKTTHARVVTHHEDTLKREETVRIEKAVDSLPDHPTAPETLSASTFVEPLQTEPVHQKTVDLPPPIVAPIVPVSNESKQIPHKPERRVEVHIGHLEVRTTTPAPPRPRPRTESKNPGPDLNQYLRGRT